MTIYLLVRHEFGTAPELPMESSTGKRPPGARRRLTVGTSSPLVVREFTEHFEAKSNKKASKAKTQKLMR